MNVIDLTQIIEAAVKLVVAIVCVLIIPYIKRNFSMSQIEDLRKWINIAVQAAEQIYNSSQAAEKKEYAVKYINKYLDEKGLKINETEIDGMIESAVLELHNQLYGSTKEESK